MKSSRIRLLFSALLLVASSLSLATGSLPPPPAKTEAGSYQGTWYYGDRASRIAVWCDEKKDQVKVRYRYSLTNGGYGDSETGKSLSSTGPGTLTVKAHLDEDRVIRGQIIRSWNGPEELSITERNDIECYRILDGERLYCLFNNGVRDTTQSGRTVSGPMEPTMFSFVKATDELVFWEELPF